MAIARALVTDPAILLADEPTGNLDSRVSEEIMAILQELNAQGRTVIAITHEHDIAQFAGRVVAFRDGRIVSDQPVDDRRIARRSVPEGECRMNVGWMRVANIVKVGLQSIARNKMRSALTMLGIVIGVACVIAMVAVASGASRSIQAQIDALGTNFLMIFPGTTTSSGARMFSGSSNLSVEDAAAIRAECPSVAYVSASVAHLGAGGGGRAQLGDADPGGRRRLAVHPLLERRRGRFLHRRRRARGDQGRGARPHGGRRALPDGQAVGETIRIKNVPVPRRRRAREEGRLDDGAGSGRRDHRPVHDGDEAARGHARGSA